MTTLHTTPPDIPTLLHESGTTIAVVGATDSSTKYGAKIYRDLKSKGFRVFAVNPTRDEVDGDPCWHRLTDLPESPTIVDFVIPPARTLRTLDECLDLGLMNVWIQPGAEDDAVLSFLEEHDFNYLANACIMIQARHPA